MNEKKLREYFDFDEADLEANRKGVLSARQKKHVAAKNKSSGIFGWGVASILFLVAGIGIFAALSAILNSTDWVERLIFGAVFGIIWPLIWGGIGYGLIQSSRPKTNYRVKAERGPLKLVKHEAPDSVAYYELQVGSRSAEMDQDPTGIIAEGEPYALYYVEITKEMVSLERISKAK